MPGVLPCSEKRQGERKEGKVMHLTTTAPWACKLIHLKNYSEMHMKSTNLYTNNDPSFELLQLMGMTTKIWPHPNSGESNALQKLQLLAPASLQLSAPASLASE